jgi:hypothetical protein
MKIKKKKCACCLIRNKPDPSNSICGCVNKYLVKNCVRSIHGSFSPHWGDANLLLNARKNTRMLSEYRIQNMHGWRFDGRNNIYLICCYERGFPSKNLSSLEYLQNGLFNGVKINPSSTELLEYGVKNSFDASSPRLLLELTRKQKFTTLAFH